MINYLLFLAINLYTVVSQSDPCQAYQSSTSCKAQQNSQSCVWVSSQSYCESYSSSGTYSCSDLTASTCTTHKQTDLFCKYTTSCISTVYDQVPCNYVNLDLAKCYLTTQQCYTNMADECLSYQNLAIQCQSRSQGACKQLASNDLGQFCIFDGSISKCKDDDPNNYLCTERHSQQTCYTNTRNCVFNSGSSTCSNYDSTYKNYQCSQLPQSKCETHLQPGLMCQASTTCTDDDDFTQHQCTFANQNTHSCFETQYQSTYCAFSSTNTCVDYQSTASYKCNQLTKYTCEQHTQANLFCKLDTTKSDTCQIVTYNDVGCTYANHNQSTCTNSSKNCVWKSDNKCYDYDASFTVTCDQLSSISCLTHQQSALFCRLDSQYKCITESLDNVPCSHINQNQNTCALTVQKCVFDSTCQNASAVTSYSCSQLSKGFCNLADAEGVFCLYNSSCLDDDPDKYPCNSHHSLPTCVKNPNVCAYENDVCATYNASTNYSSCDSLPLSKCNSHLQPKSGLVCDIQFGFCFVSYSKFDCTYQNQNQNTCFQTRFVDNETITCAFIDNNCQRYSQSLTYSCDQLSQDTCQKHKQFDLFCGLDGLSCKTITYKDVACDYPNLNSSTCVNVQSNDCSLKNQTNECENYDSTLYYRCYQLSILLCEIHIQVGLYCAIINGTCTDVDKNSRCDLANQLQSDCLTGPPSCYWTSDNLCKQYTGDYPISDVQGCLANQSVCQYIQSGRCYVKASTCIEPNIDTPVIYFDITYMNKPFCDLAGHYWNSTSLSCKNTTVTDCSQHLTQQSCINQYIAYQYCSWTDKDQPCQDQRTNMRQGLGCQSNLNIQACLYSSAQCTIKTCNLGQWFPPTISITQGCFPIYQSNENVTCTLTSASGCSQQTKAGLKCSITNGRCGDLKSGQSCQHGLNKEACLSLQNCVFYLNRCQYYYPRMKNQLPCSAYPSSLCLSILPPYPMHMCALIDNTCSQITSNDATSLTVQCMYRNQGACQSNILLGGPCKWQDGMCLNVLTSESVTFENCNVQVDGPHYIDYNTIKCVTPTNDDWKTELNCLHPGLNEVACKSLKSPYKTCTWDSDNNKCY